VHDARALFLLTQSYLQATSHPSTSISFTTKLYPEPQKFD
jgi:hypothetical protein